MPISKQDYLKNVPGFMFANVRMLGKVTKVSEYLRTLNDPNNADLSNTLSTIQEGLTFLSFQGSAENISDEDYQKYMAAMDRLPTLIHTKINPTEKTVRDYLMEGLSPDEIKASDKELTDFYSAYELSFTKSREERDKELKAAEEEKLRQLDLETNGNPLDAIPVFPEELKTGQKNTASQWIKNIRDVHNASHNFTMTNCSEIMAARLLADSDRNHADKLVGKTLFKREIDDTARWLRDNCNFKDFFDKNRKKIFSASQTGHGGGIDDLFKDYVKKLPAGEMPTRGLYSRYMPTALERIDELKKQIKAGKDPVLAAAEIVTLRNLVKAEQGKKETLGRKLTPEQMQQLKVQSQLLSQDPTFKSMVLDDPAARNLLTKGHGGDFLEHIRNAEKQHPEMNKDAVAVLNAGTLGVHMEELRKEAAKKQLELKQELERQANLGEKRDLSKAWEQIGEAKKLLAEYIACDNISRKPIKGQPDPERRLLQDVPATKINEQVDKRDQNQTFKNLTSNISPLKAVELLGNMASKQPDEFLRGLAENIKIEEAPRESVQSSNNINRSEAEKQNVLNI